jgi:hypothetical protein
MNSPKAPQQSPQVAFAVRLSKLAQHTRATLHGGDWVIAAADDRKALFRPNKTTWPLFVTKRRLFEGETVHEDAYRSEWFSHRSAVVQ